MKGQIQRKEDIKERDATRRVSLGFGENLIEESGHEKKGETELLMKVCCLKVCGRMSIQVPR